MVKFDHDFTGREALEKIARNPRRQKVTLAWNGEDVTRVIASLFQKGNPYKCIDLPLTNYASLSYDRVVKNGKMVGLSTFSSYSFNERSMLSLGILENEYSAAGTEVTLVWGEEGGGSAKPTVEATSKLKFGPLSGLCPTASRPESRTPTVGERGRNSHKKALNSQKFCVLLVPLCGYFFVILKSPLRLSWFQLPLSVSLLSFPSTT